jgi:hypothetical protein
MKYTSQMHIPCKEKQRHMAQDDQLSAPLVRQESCVCVTCLVYCYGVNVTCIKNVYVSLKMMLKTIKIVMQTKLLPYEPYWKPFPSLRFNYTALFYRLQFDYVGFFSPPYFGWFLNGHTYVYIFHYNVLFVNMLLPYAYLLHRRASLLSGTLETVMWSHGILHQSGRQALKVV